MKIFLTGGDGFIGRHLLPALVSSGHEVTALAGEPGSPQALRALGATRLVEGRLERPEAWLTQIAGHDAMIHLAGPVTVWGTWSLFEQTMVRATQAVHDACLRFDVPRFIYTSSETVHWGRDVRSLIDIDETAPFSLQPYAHYSRAKQLAERYLQAAPGPHTIILRLPFVWGPGSKFLDVLIRQVQRGQFMWVGEAEMPLESVHVANVTAGILAALEQGRSGQAYFLTDDHPYQLHAFMAAIIQALGLPLPKRRAPMRPLAWAVMGAEMAWKGLRLPGSPFPMTRFELAFFTLPRRYRIHRARQELDFAPVISWEEGLSTLREQHNLFRARQFEGAA